MRAMHGGNPSGKGMSSDIPFNIVLLATAIGLFVVLVWIKKDTLAQFLLDPVVYSYALFVTVFRISRLLGAALYPHSYATLVPRDVGGYEPTVSFVVPCKNEEASIATTVTKCFEVDYPAEKVEVIVINDGSTDRTLEILTALQPTYPRLIIIDWKVNRGKRHGMVEGFRRASGEIVVQLDSDSYIEPSTFRNLIKPFANPLIGGVSAHTDAANADANLLTRMQEAYYYVSFKIQKAAESTFHVVFCLSGCCSAYRREVTLPALDAFLGERFLGLPVTWGDDRALTNWVIRRGYKTIYLDNVQAYTICPERLKMLFKQQVRWKKGWFVNSVLISKFMATEHPFIAVTYLFPLIAISLLTPFIALKAFVYDPLVHHLFPTTYLLGIFLVMSLTVVYYRYVARDHRYWPYIYLWMLLNSAVLTFVMFYALATIQDRRWGTR